MQGILQINKEQKICQSEKTNILIDLKQIKMIINNLVTANINGPDNEKLELLEFYLDRGLYNQKTDLNKQECKKTEIYHKALIVAQDKVSKYLMENCWDSMQTKSQIVRGIFNRTEVSNFALLPQELVIDRLDWVHELRKVEQFLKVSDCFTPWAILPEE